MKDVSGQPTLHCPRTFPVWVVVVPGRFPLLVVELGVGLLQLLGLVVKLQGHALAHGALVLSDLVGALHQVLVRVPGWRPRLEQGSKEGGGSMRHFGGGTGAVVG